MQEARIAAARANEEVMVEVFRNNGDVHLKTASLIFKEEITSKQDPRRSIGKKVLFTTLYGGGASKIAADINIPLVEAKRVLNSFKESYPNLHRITDETYAAARLSGYILINPILGRKSYIKDFDKYKLIEKHIARWESYGWGRDIHPKILNYFSYYDSKIKRHAGNYPIQGTGADMTKQACINLSNDTRIVLMVHDEIVLICKREDSLKIKDALEHAMLEASRKFNPILDVPGEGKITKTWNK